MAEKEHWEDIRELMELVRPLAQLLVRKIEEGIRAEEIAAIFAKVFFHQFKDVLTDRAVVKVRSGSRYQQGSFQKDEAAISYCLSLAPQLVAAVNHEMRQRNQRKEKS